MPELYVLQNGERIPFSREILARSISIAGETKARSYSLSESIMKEILKSGKTEIVDTDLADMVYNKLKGKNPTIAENYQFWRKFKKNRDPLIILIAGGTGTGSTSIGVEISSRLGVSTISTDIIRAVLRGHIPQHLRPSLHESSYMAWRTFGGLMVKNRVILGYIKHIEPVAKSIELLVKRATDEGFSLIIEGVHICPGFISKELLSKPYVHLVALNLNKKSHRERFTKREFQTKFRRPAERYLQHFEEIRQIQRYIVSQAKANFVPVVRSEDSVKAASEIIKIVTKEMMDAYKEDDINRYLVENQKRK
ncbi:MAG: ATP cone domain-containing protein [Candidatus Thorarchaeota archaeon]